jgi:hypothetical protein
MGEVKVPVGSYLLVARGDAASSSRLVNADAASATAAAEGCCPSCLSARLVLVVRVMAFSFVGRTHKVRGMG